MAALEREDRSRSVSEDGRRADAHRTPAAPFGRAIGRTRFVVLIAVAAVMLVALALFVLGTWQAVRGIWNGFSTALRGELISADLTVEFLEIVSTMLKAVFFYIIGVGMYSLFIAPLNVTTALGMETLGDLETRVISIVVVILAVTFLEHFIRWEQAYDTMLFGVTLAAVVASLVLFQWLNQRVKEHEKANDADQVEAQRELFQEDREQSDVRSEKAVGARNGADREPSRSP
jgi:uncharacterized membrane protein YqhA